MTPPFAPVPSPARRWNAAGCAVGIALVALVFLSNGNHRGPSESGVLRGGDFLQEYVGGWIVRYGDRAHFYDPGYASQLEHDPSVVGFTFDEARYLPMVYPPFYYVLVSPLSALPYPVASAVWFALMAAAGAGVVVLWRRLTSGSPRLLAWAVPAAVLYAPTLESLTSNQKATVVLLLFTATYHLLDRGRPLLAGLVFGLVAFKPQLGLVVGLAMLVTGQWRFVLGAAATVGALVGLSLAVGLDVCRQYVEFARGAGEYIRTAGFPHDRAHTWQAFFHLLMPSDPRASGALTVAASAATLLLLVSVLRGFGADRRRLPLQFAALTTASVLVSPHLLTYDLTVMLLPMLLVLTAAQEGNPYLAGRERVAVGWVVVFYALSGVSPGVAAATGMQATVPLLFALVAGIASIRSASVLGRHGSKAVDSERPVERRPGTACAGVPSVSAACRGAGSR